MHIYQPVIFKRLPHLVEIFKVCSIQHVHVNYSKFGRTCIVYTDKYMPNRAELIRTGPQYIFLRTSGQQDRVFWKLIRATVILILLADVAMPTIAFSFLQKRQADRLMYFVESLDISLRSEPRQANLCLQAFCPVKF